MALNSQLVSAVLELMTNSVLFAYYLGKAFGQKDIIKTIIKKGISTVLTALVIVQSQYLVTNFRLHDLVSRMNI